MIGLILKFMTSQPGKQAISITYCLITQEVKESRQ